jgi:hypothetical protein
MAAMKPIAGSQHVWSAALRQTQKRLRRTAQLISSGPVGKEFLLTIPFVGSSDTRLPSWPEILAPSCARSADLPSAIIRIPSWRRSTAVYRHSREYVRPPPCVAHSSSAAGRSGSRWEFPTVAQIASTAPASGHNRVPIAGTTSSARAFRCAAPAGSQSSRPYRGQSRAALLDKRIPHIVVFD